MCNLHNKDSGHKGMLLMMIPCLLLVGFLLLGGGKLSSSGYLWPIIIGICVIGHAWMMFKGHGKHGDTHTEEKSDEAVGTSDIKGEHTGDKKGGCCH